LSALGLNLGLPKVLDVPVDSCGWAEAFSEDDGTFKTISCGMLIADEDSFE
jgi:hypothetical protein